MYLFKAILCPIIDAGMFSNGFKGMQWTSCSKKEDLKQDKYTD
jgi:hypothetical protein